MKTKFSVNKENAGINFKRHRTLKKCLSTILLEEVIFHIQMQTFEFVQSWSGSGFVVHGRCF